jgi:hypothetical protein
MAFWAALDLRRSRRSMAATSALPLLPSTLAAPLAAASVLLGIGHRPRRRLGDTSRVVRVCRRAPRGARQRPPASLTNPRMQPTGRICPEPPLGR